jgi:hypothetical protein
MTREKIIEILNAKSIHLPDRDYIPFNLVGDIADAILALFEQSEKKLHAHLRNRCLMAFEELMFNHNADAVTLPEPQLKAIRKLIKDLQP